MPSAFFEPRERGERVAWFDGVIRGLGVCVCVCVCWDSASAEILGDKGGERFRGAVMMEGVTSERGN